MRWRTKYRNDLTGRSLNIAYIHILLASRRISMYDCKCRQLMCIRIDRTFTYRRFIWHDVSAQASNIVEQNRSLPLEKPMLHSDRLTRSHSYVAHTVDWEIYRGHFHYVSFSLTERKQDPHRDDLYKRDTRRLYLHVLSRLLIMDSLKKVDDIPIHY